jgi:malto-oligosyltrehalose synthase
LREALGRGDLRPYLVVEKILATDERLSTDWPVDGTTGYDFMERVSALLHDPKGEAALTALWAETGGDARSFDEVAADARREILLRLFPKQLDRLVAIARVAAGAEIDPAAVVAVLVALRRYRLYGDARGFDPQDSAALAAAIADARRSGVPSDALEAIRQALPHAAVRQRFGQLSATLAAKAVEDTAFYRYHRLISRNEVGGDPGRLSIAAEDFHADAADRRERFPAAMLATATHDQKRGEDARARIAVLSEIAEEWAEQARRWLAVLPPPDPKVGLMILEMVIGAWPLGEDEVASYHERLKAWLVKALREGKQQTSWERPDEMFERDALDYLARLVGTKRDELAAFADRIAVAGAVNGLVQTLLRLTVPGVPDLYQGTEFWDFSLVDPDNRRAVDFEARMQGLTAAEPIDALLPHWRDGRIKQALIARLLDARRRQPRLFAAGSYEPIAASGPRAEHVVAFLRRLDDTALVVIAARRMAEPLLGAAEPSVAASFWEGTTIPLPQGVRCGRHLRTKPGSEGNVVALDELLSPLPFAVIEAG